MSAELWPLAPLFLVASFLYSSVGHGGASAYLAIAALVGLSREVMAPIALALNILVAGIGFSNYWRAGHFSGQLLLPFVLTSIPAAFLGGTVTISPRLFSGLLGLSLLLAAVRLLWLGEKIQTRWSISPRLHWPLRLLIGLVLGLLAGLIGIGGGIFLSPLLLFLGWADNKRTAATSSAFIVLNSLSGLSARSLQSGLDWSLLLPLMLVVAVGGGLGSLLGAKSLSQVTLQRLLGSVLLIASAKLLSQAMMI